MKTCAACGADNRDTALFCRRCSRRLLSERRCPSCGRGNPPDAQFCNKCSTPLAGAVAPAPGLTGQLAPQSQLAARPEHSVQSAVSIHAMTVAYHHKPVLWDVDYDAPANALLR